MNPTQLKPILKDAYIIAVKTHSLSKKILAPLHDVTENQIEKWLYVKNAYPAFQQLMEIEIYLQVMNLTVPDEVKIVLQAPKLQVDSYVSTLAINPITNKEIRKSDPIRYRDKEYQRAYGYLRRLKKSGVKIEVTAAELIYKAKDLGYQKGSFDFFLNENFNKSNEIARIKDIDIKAKIRYIFNGELSSVSDISRLLNISRDTVNTVINHLNLNINDVFLKEMVNQYVTENYAHYIYLGELTSVSKIAKLINRDSNWIMKALMWGGNKVSY